MINAVQQNVSGKKVALTGNTDSRNWIIQPADLRELEAIGTETQELERILRHQDWCIAVLEISDWNRELSPWEAPPVFGKEGFGDGAESLLNYIRRDLIPYLDGAFPVCRHEYMICGYSLAGLFSLWSAYRTDFFQGVAAVSPSVWFPGWTEFAERNDIRTKAVYLSLGDREEKTKNPVMAQVGDAVRAQSQYLRQKGIPSILEWNPGNHFMDSEARTAKGIAWLLSQKK